MDKLSSKLDKFYTDFYEFEINTRKKSSQNQIDLNTSLDQHFKDLEYLESKDQSSDYED
ncbi:unnamed protein product [Paramecium pentaurelia]|uniref:Uncharacterized protein n=1 Tax=Paramecium pentaurelia TaxID=43138 RepID=A0A8S1SX83_9CILI|nr:unnamed protein product [Paramecium pentaurelia]